MANIRKEFLSLLKGIGKQEGFECKKYESTRRSTKNIIELSGDMRSLFYFKIRSAAPPRWGITSKRIEELKTSGKKRFVVLLYEAPDNGYLLTANDIARYIRENLWPLGRDKNKNEYKIGPTKTLQYNKPFHTFRDFIKSLRIKLQQ